MKVAHPGMQYLLVAQALRGSPPIQVATGQSAARHPVLSGDGAVRIPALTPHGKVLVAQSAGPQAPGA